MERVKKSVEAYISQLEHKEGRTALTVVLEDLLNKINELVDKGNKREEVRTVEAHTIKIDYPIEDFGMMLTAILNGNKLDIRGLTKWSFVLEVGHEPRVEMKPYPGKLYYPKEKKQP